MPSGRVSKRITTGILWALLIFAPSSTCIAFVLANCNAIKEPEHWYPVARTSEFRQGKPALNKIVQLKMLDAWETQSRKSVLIYVTQFNGQIYALASHYSELKFSVFFDSETNSFQSYCHSLTFDLKGHCYQEPDSDEKLRQFQTRSENGIIYVRL